MEVREETETRSSFCRRQLKAQEAPDSDGRRRSFLGVFDVVFGTFVNPVLKAFVGAIQAATGNPELRQLTSRILGDFGKSGDGSNKETTWRSKCQCKNLRHYVWLLRLLLELLLLRVVVLLVVLLLVLQLLPQRKKLHTFRGLINLRHPAAPKSGRGFIYRFYFRKQKVIFLWSPAKWSQ